MAMATFFLSKFKNPWMWALILLCTDLQPIISRQDEQTTKESVNTVSSNTQDRPVLPYWHIWTDDNGFTHQTRCQMTSFDFQSISAGAAPSWIDRLGTAATNVVMLILPVGWVGEWHENPEPQWIIPLSGRWFVESMDGTRVEMGPGEMSFGNDQNSKTDPQGRRGHRSGTLGKEPAVLMLVQLKGDFPVGKTCIFK